MNEPDFFWKNFRLGTELQISGAFIFNALNFIDKIEYYHFEEDVFEILYNLSVGIERLEKIVIVLIEHNEQSNQEQFEKSLITHNLQDLISRIKKTEKLKLGKVHNKLLMLLTNFYNSYRYKRFNKDSVYHKNYDKFDFINFIKDELHRSSDKDDYISNDLRIKKFLGKLVLTITTQLYEIIKNYSYKLGTFTYEIRYNSKAFKIFIVKEYTFENENNFKREILINLLNENGIKDEIIDYIKTLKPVNLESYNSSDYIKFLFNPENNQHYMSEYAHLIDEKKVDCKRVKEISFIGENHYLSNDLNFSDDVETEE
ncbi:hypothetical protein HX004_17015 [Myroides sp. 1354]|uniref:hypothetical protein n=1 Tax=unclassified Myroides TaxID=2642485 RepID=UPI002577FE0A|nr:MULTISPECIES: hypothetical protein [unclassified Myroides]MDM1046541.1 hypothetical protein [Myroides sp. R163-1]MDM1057458.1 hypothetical protein [Myroides sp. 1354]MDM1070743.1 hypothetical protein [Myroides sp. 1372]